jgi:hypothetical protein
VRRLIKPIFHRQDDLCTIVEIPVQSSKIGTIRNILQMNGVPHMTPDCNHGWQYEDGGFIIVGSASAVKTIVDKILVSLNGPSFETADKIAERHKQGAMS